MRTFGTDSPKFYTFKIVGRDKVYKLPVLTSIDYDLTDRLAHVATIEDATIANAEAIRVQRDILLKYIGDEAREFPTDAVSDLFSDWMQYSGEETGVDAGEFSGSSELSENTEQPLTLT